MSRKISIIVTLVLLMMVSFHCKKQTQIKGIDLNVSFSEEQLSDHLITDMTFDWKTMSDLEKISQDYMVFVHFWHKNNLLFQDDHMPELATTQWEPDKTYTYKRRIYIPDFIDEFDADFKGPENLKLIIGFFSPYDRSGKSKQDILSKNLKVFPPPLDTPDVIYENGWYDLEINPDAYLKQWRWTGKEARCVIDNPHRDALLVIKGGVNLEVLKEQTVIFKINELTLDEFIPQESHFEKPYNIKNEMLGKGEQFVLTITTDKTFIPAETIPKSKDSRELGVQISFIYFR